MTDTTESIMNDSFNKKVTFFKTCYQADNREQNIWNILSTQHEFFRTFSTEEVSKLMADESVELPLEYGQNLEYAVMTYRREKTLLLAGMYVAGRVSGMSSFGSKTKKICAPLILFEARIIKEVGRYYIAVDTVNYRWNTSLLNILIDDRKRINDIDTYVSIDQIKKGNAELLLNWISEGENENELTDFTESPEDADSLKKLMNKKKGLTLVNGFSALLSTRSLSSRGIIDELDQIASHSEISGPLEQVFTRKNGETTDIRSANFDNVPGILSNTQEKALHNAAGQTLSMMIGPPGTGKSYTIACMALERFLQGESVLIVSENEHAVDVIQEKLVEQLGISANAILRAGNSDYHKYLVNYIENLTKNIGIEEPGDSFEEALIEIRQSILEQEKQFNKISKKAVSDGIYLDNAMMNPGFGPIQRFKIWLQKRRLEKYGHLHDQLNDIQLAYKSREDLLAQHINRTHLENVRYTLENHRTELVSFLKGLKARTSDRQEKMFKSIDYRILLRTMPVWLCSISALSRALPLNKELFDLVIIDEATQCDFASCIPALFRAKRAVITGDPKQLRHISFLSRHKQESICRKLKLEGASIELNYRDNSMIDFADQSIADQAAITLLDEHYRSLPEIISFSNKTFYNNRLRVMTEKPQHVSSRPVEIIPVKKGERIKGVNEEEVKAVMGKLSELVNSQQSIPGEYKLSIGVLSFFRDQTEALQKSIIKEFSMNDISAHKLRAGTPYAFQGEERDIMLISCAVGTDEKKGVYVYLNREDVFNVAVTRARHSQILFLSADPDTIPKNNLLNHYIKSIQAEAVIEHVKIPERDRNIDLLAEELYSHGMNVLRDYPIAGFPMDLVITSGMSTLAIDVIGFPGEYQDVFHLDRYKIFERAGLRIFPLSYTAWIYSRQKVIDDLNSMLEEVKKSESLLMISGQSASSHWSKLLAVNPGLAKKVRSLELSLTALNMETALSQIGKLVERYQNFIWLLSKKLKPTELTYTRYAAAAEQVLLGGLDNLDKIVLYKHSLPDFDPAPDENENNEDCHKKQKEAIQTLLDLNNRAIKRLEEITFEWSNVDTGTGATSASLSDSLTELERLKENVKNYSL